jgi:cysteine desulfurase family protein
LRNNSCLVKLGGELTKINPLTKLKNQGEYNIMVNFDNSATTYPKPKSVRQAADTAIIKYGGNPGRGGHSLSMQTGEAVFDARCTIAEFFGANPENTVFTVNCTAALNYAIKGVLSGGDHCIISCLEHNSVSRPVHSLYKKNNILYDIARVFENDTDTISEFENLLKPNTKAIICTLASNVTGEILPVKQIGDLCRRNGLIFILDGSQGCGLMPFSMPENNVNILCTSGHKGLYGLTGTGLLISDGNTDIAPLIEGGTGSNSLDLDMPDFLPDSLEPGTVNVTGIITVAAGIKFINSIGIDKIRNQEEKLCTFLLKNLNENVRVYRSENAKYLPIVSFNVDGKKSEEVSDILNRRGFCLRSGFHCAALTHKYLGTEFGTVRFSPSYFNTLDEVKKLLFVLNKL